MSINSIIGIMKKFGLYLSFFIITFLYGCKFNTPSTIHMYDGYYFNTYVSVSLYGCGSEEVAKNAVELCGYYEKIFSRTNDDSLLYQLNKEGKIKVDSQEAKILSEVLKFGVQYYEVTDGALNIAVEPLTALWNFSEGVSIVPDEKEIEEALYNTDCSYIDISEDEINLNGVRVDLGAVAKGYVADCIKEYLVEEGIDSAIINLGGNILCIGDKPTGDDFVIGIQKPFYNEPLLGLKVDGMSVVTSGTYERYFEQDGVLYHHILDPDTGMPCNTGLLSVTIIAESGILCDCLSTGCFVMGMEDAMELINNMENVYAVFVDDDYNVYYTEGANAFVK